MLELNQKAADNLTAVREKEPLVHGIINFVVMNYTANSLLAAGALPVMAHAPEEVEEMTGLADALVLNMGTPTVSRVAVMIKAGKKAISIGLPVVFDPVGAGTTALRNRSAREIISSVVPSVIRGNPSEILSLAGSNSVPRGIAAIHRTTEAAGIGIELAARLKTVLAISGQVDWVSDGQRVVRVGNGHPLMQKIVGTGCTASALVGAFLSVDRDPVSAAATAVAYYGLAGEMAAERASAPGSYMSALLDALFLISPEVLAEKSRFEIDENPD